MFFYLKTTILCILLLAINLPVFSQGLGLQEILDLTESLNRMKERKAIQEQLHDQQLFRPSPEERDAVAELLEEPRHVTLLAGDVQFLKSLLQAPAWTGAEQRIMHAIWKEVVGMTLQMEK